MAKAGIYDRITEIAARRGFFWPSFEIYGGLSGFVTYGSLGVKLKRNIEAAWRESFVRPHGFLELDDPVINPQRIFEASGHLEHFKEYMVECGLCARGHRADHLIEEQMKLENVGAMGGDEILRLLNEGKVKCPDCGGDLRAPTMFLTMFQTTIGPTGGEVGFARPEAAQGMFINFRRGLQHAREKLPFALAQVGRVLRNEISPRRGMHRLREFTIMELELFFDPGQPACPWLDEVSGEEIHLFTEEMEEHGEKDPLTETIGEAVDAGHIRTEWQAYFMGVSKRFVGQLGVPPERQRFRAHLPLERSHYSAQTFDHEVLLESWGWTEVAGHAYRTDYDLNAHQRGSGVDLSVLRPDGTRVIPHVVEPSFGLDRLLYTTLENSYLRRKDRNILAMPRNITPFNASVFPLVTRDGLPEKAMDVRRTLLKTGLTIEYDDNGSIGRRYARADEIGTPLAITIDYQTLDDETVTLRDRDSWSQVRQSTQMLPDLICRYFKAEIDFDGLGSPV
jgi:glycyl-tRNA synthetase